MMRSPAGRAATVSTDCAFRRRVALAGSARPVASTAARPMMACLTHSGMVARLIRKQRAIEDHTGTKKAKICPDRSHALSTCEVSTPSAIPQAAVRLGKWLLQFHEHARSGRTGASPAGYL